MFTRLFALYCASVLIGIAFIGPPSLVRAQNTDSTKSFIIEALPDQLARRVESQRKTLKQFGLADPDKTSKGVINALKVWTDYPVIRICFFPSSKDVRVRIAKVAMGWQNAVPGLPLDFGDLEDPRLCQDTEVNHIRVGYAFNGYWSLVGTDSIKLADQDQQSMNLEGFDSTPPDDSEFNAFVLHEFGHAIGLKHEHQNPLSKCHDEFDWPAIYKRLAGPRNYWSKEKVDFNMGVLHEQGLLATEFDNRSIMLYTFPAWFYKNGTNASCYSEANTTLSAGDKAIVAELYPTGTSARAAVVDKIRQHHLALIEASGQAEGAKSAGIALIDKYVPERTDTVTPQR